MAEAVQAIHSSSAILAPRPPFDFRHSLAFLRSFSATEGEQEIAGGVLTKAVPVDGAAVVFSARAAGDDVEAPALECTLHAGEPLTAVLETAALDRIAFYLSLYDELEPFYELAEDDPPFLPVVRQLYGYHQVKFATPFENACWAILTQRTQPAVARRAKAELVRRYGTALIVAGATYRAFPSPAELAGATLDELTEAVGNGRKAAYLLGLARAFGEMPEAFLRHGPYEEVAGWLRGLRGIGEWSASFVLIRGLGRMDRGLIDDPQGRFTQHMLEAARRVYGAGVTFERLQELAAHYGPWQGYWAHYLRAAA